MKKHRIRIVGGCYRRTLISVPDGAHLRPTPDRVRETLFNWLSHLWEGDFASRHVLDLFAGSGALGFEAASRGAARVDLVEKDPVALRALHALQARLQSPAIRIIAADAFRYLRQIPAGSIDLVLLDPPFGQFSRAQLLSAIAHVPRRDGLVYLESNAREDALPAQWHCLRAGHAGKVHFQLLRFAAASENRNNPAATSPAPPSPSRLFSPESA